MAKTLSSLPVGTLVKDVNTKYNGKPIIFRIIDKNHSGYPANSVTLITDKIISIKPFDATESGGDSNRQNYGNNRYAHSNIRQWLNKEVHPWYQSQHSYDRPPNDSYVWDGYNDYEKEAGFLSNFSNEFKTNILSTTLTVVKTSVDGGGTEQVTDKVFLLSRTEVGLGNENDADGVPFSYFNSDSARMAYPTAEAVSKSEYTNSSLNANQPWYWWLRTPYAGYSNHVRSVYTSGGLYYNNAYYGNHGVRPALNLKSDILVSDNPDSDGAYIIQFNAAPIISGQNENLGNKTAPFSVVYQVSDPEGDSVNVVEKVNGQVIRTITGVQQNTNLEISISGDLWKNLPLNQAVSVVIEATDSKGATSTRTYTFTKVNSAPTAIIIEPKGDLANIAIVDTLTPVFVHQFQDPDSGDVQTAYQYIIEDLQENIVHDTGKKLSTQSFFQVPQGVLNWGVRYKFKVRVWDKFDVPSEYSPYEFFLPNRAPNVTDVHPGTNDSQNPMGAGTAPEFTWAFEDLDLEAQQSYQLKIYNLSDALVYDSSRIYKNVNKHQIPDGVLSDGTVYYATVTVWDPNGLSTTSEKAYFRTNATPDAPILTGPVDNYRTDLKPTFVGIVGTDLENNGMHFAIQISKDSNFEGDEVLTFRSDQDRTGWQVGGYDIPQEGVFNDKQGQQVSYTMQFDLDRNQTYYWRMAAIDASTGALGKWSQVRRIRAGNVLQFHLKKPISTDAVAARRILFAMDYNLATDGSDKASIKVEATNNAFDVNPTWEDMTQAFLNMDYYNFQNTEKTAESFGIDVRVTINANESMGPISIDAIGLTFD